MKQTQQKKQPTHHDGFTDHYPDLALRNSQVCSTSMTSKIMSIQILGV